MRYWVVNDTGYQYQVSFAGYNGIESRIRADSIGNPVVKGECIPSYLSKQSDFLDNSWDLIPDCGTPFRIFFAEPAADLPRSAKLGNVEIPVLPAPVEREDLAIADLRFASTASTSSDGEFSWSLTPRFVGSYWLDIDVDGDGSYAGPRDRRVQQYADGSGSYSYAFDGLDGEGNAIADCTQMNARIYFDKIGEVHLVQEDVEGREGGIEVVRLNGPGSPDATLYWNDTQLSGVRANTTPILDGTAGIDSTGGVHEWALALNSWGNDRVIDDWTFTPLDETAAEISIESGCLSIEKTSDAVQNARVGQVVNYEVQLTNTGSADFVAAVPASFSDDLTDVLDDATFNDDAAVTFSAGSTGSAPALSGVSLNWQGELKAGETATFTYSVTLTGAGNGVVVNTACVPEDLAGASENCASTRTEIPILGVSKSVDPESGTQVEPGQLVTYTLTFSNSGAAPGDIRYTDDLTDVLDDAELTDGPIASDAAVIASRDGDQLDIAGSLAAGQTVSVMYSVTVLPDGSRGNNLLGNMLADSEDKDPECGDAGVFCTENPIGELVTWKTVDPASGTAVLAGETLTYTLHFQNTGKAPVTVHHDDVLTGMLDDADMATQPEASVDSVTVTPISDGRFTVAGEIAAGAAATVTYSATVKANGERGDDSLSNFLVPQGVEPPGLCDPASGERPDCTVNPVSDVVVVKSSDPESGTAVKSGQEVTYTLTFTNRSKNQDSGSEAIDYTDYMKDVLDDATILDGPSSSNSSIQSVVSRESIRITGRIPAGDSYTVSYSVLVKPYAEQGDHTLGNVIAVTGEPPVCAPDSRLCTKHDVPPAPVVSPGLALTGSDGAFALWVGGSALLAALAGAWLTLGRKRTQGSEEAPRM